MNALSPLDGCPQAPILAAIEAQEIAFLGIEDETTRIRPAQIQGLGEPSLAVVIGNHGPGRVVAARPLRAWARVGLIYAKSEQRDDYLSLLGVVQAFRRVLLIETVPSVAPAWFAFLGDRIPTTGLVAGRSLL